MGEKLNTAQRDRYSVSKGVSVGFAGKHKFCESSPSWKTRWELPCVLGMLEKLSLYLTARAGSGNIWWHLVTSASPSFGCGFNETPLLFQMSDFGVRNMDQVAPVSNMYRGMLKVSTLELSAPCQCSCCVPAVLGQELDKPSEHRFHCSPLIFCQSIPTEFHRDVKSRTEGGKCKSWTFSLLPQQGSLSPFPKFKRGSKNWVLVELLLKLRLKDEQQERICIFNLMRLAEACPDRTGQVWYLPEPCFD